MDIQVSETMLGLMYTKDLPIGLIKVIIFYSRHGINEEL